jgi:hypothetical protein
VRSAVNGDHVFYSTPGAASVYYAMSDFTQGSCGTFINSHNLKTQSLNHVFINSTEQKIVTYSGDFILTNKKETKIVGNRHVILAGTTPQNKTWSVSLIAGHVRESDTTEIDTTNAASLVTLLQAGNSKALFLGDATRATEQFLMDTHRNLISNVDFAHIPHHGSLTSSGAEFVTLVNPRGAEVTHETYESKFRLPQHDILQRWLGSRSIKGDVALHAIDYWGKITEAEYRKAISSWSGHKTGTSGSSTIFLDDVPGDYEGYIAVNNDNVGYWGLFRTRTTKELWSTGATGYVWWDLPAR